MRTLLPLLLVLVCIALLVDARIPFHPSAMRSWGLGLDSGESTFQKLGFPGAQNCTTRWFTQFIDHYSFGQPSGAAAGEMTYQQRYLTYDHYFQPGGPIFFYVGNEAPINVFANIAGLMWQHAEEFNAAIVFAEHRFYGVSQPCNGSQACFPHLSPEQALADYAVLLTNLTGPGGRYERSHGVITFGGSYGGMLSSWMRIKYPNMITGAIACSGPITMVSETFDQDSYWKVSTRDATAAGGSAANCSWNIYKAIQAALDMIDSESGRAQLQSIFKTCNPIDPTKGREQLGWFLQGAFDGMSMGNYPFPLNFIFGSLEKPAPAWPMHVACQYMADNTNDNTTLLQNLMSSISVIYNATEDVPCNDIQTPITDSGNWDYLVCSCQLPDSQPYFASKGWPHDMYFESPVWDKQRVDEHCMRKYGIKTRWGWSNTSYGAANVAGATNIVFSNGLLDPWHSGGILNNVSDTVKSYIIPEGAHHLDLLFSMPSDPPLLHFVRREHMRHIRKWLSELHN